MWLRTFTHAVANVRFKGKYVMESRTWNIALRGKRLRVAPQSGNSRRLCYHSIGTTPLVLLP